jgi:transcriptional regulator with GAF, ATPase, and Fis domain
LITGGNPIKEQAGALRHRNHSSAQPLVMIDCATLPADLLEAELFGYERGAFTGATEAKPGRLEAAHRGTVVLNEIAYLGLDAQAKLLRVIERREFERLGGRKAITVDARLIALTNADLKGAVERRAFRDDLFYRLKRAYRSAALREQVKISRR